MGEECCRDLVGVSANGLQLLMCIFPKWCKPALDLESSLVFRGGRAVVGVFAFWER